MSKAILDQLVTQRQSSTTKGVYSIQIPCSKGPLLHHNEGGAFKRRAGCGVAAPAKMINRCHQQAGRAPRAAAVEVFLPWAGLGPSSLSSLWHLLVLLSPFFFPSMHCILSNEVI